MCALNSSEPGGCGEESISKGPWRTLLCLLFPVARYLINQNSGRWENKNSGSGVALSLPQLWIQSRHQFLQSHSVLHCQSHGKINGMLEWLWACSMRGEGNSTQLYFEGSFACVAGEVWEPWTSRNLPQDECAEINISLLCWGLTIHAGSWWCIRVIQSHQNALILIKRGITLPSRKSLLHRISSSDLSNKLKRENWTNKLYLVFGQVIFWVKTEFDFHW